MGVVASTPASHQEWTSASNLVRPSLFSPPELWHDYENPVFVIPDAFQLENEDKRTLIQHHITQGRNFEINRETGNIKKNSMTQKKYSLHSIQPMITIDEKSIKFIPIFSISQANEMKEHVPSSSSSGVRQRIENYLKFSLNFKYSANIDCIIYISFSATINNSADNLSFSGTKFTSPAITVAAGLNKTFRSKDHNFYAKFDYFPTLFDWEQLQDSFNARKTKLFDVTVLAMPKTPTSETRETFQAPRQFGFNKRYQSSNHPFLGFPSAISLYRASDTLIRDSTHSVGESTVHGTIHRPFKELHCLQIDLYSLQRTMQFIKQLQLIEEPSPVNPPPTERERDNVIEVRSNTSIKTKPSSIVSVLSSPNNLTESTTPSFATLPMSRMNSERQLQRSDSTLPHLMKAKLPQTKDTIVITSSPIQINLLDHYIELSKGVYHMYSTYGADNIKLKDTPVVAPRQPSATKPHPNELIDSPTRIKPGISYQDRRFSITSDCEEKKNDDQDSPQDLLHLRRRSLTQHQTPLNSEVCNSGSNQNDDSDHYCLICFTNKTDIVLFPCRHYNFCLECSQTLIEKSPNCPVCRVSIKFTIHVPTVEK